MAPGEPFSQRRIGLTGGIASGKSSVGHWLAQQGLPVLDADQFAREALTPGRPATNSVMQRYGAPVFRPREERSTEPPWVASCSRTPERSLIDRAGALIKRSACGRMIRCCSKQLCTRSGWSTAMNRNSNA